MTNTLQTLNSDEARGLLDAVLANAESPISVAIADVSGAPVLAARMDGAAPISLTMAIGKAATSVSFKAPTAAVMGDAVNFPQLGITLSSLADVVLLPGGVPVLVQGQVVGAVGIAGGPGQADHDLAEAAIAAWAGEQGAR